MAKQPSKPGYVDKVFSRMGGYDGLGLSLQDFQSQLVKDAEYRRRIYTDLGGQEVIGSFNKFQNVITGGAVPLYAPPSQAEIETNRRMMQVADLKKKVGGEELPSAPQSTLQKGINDAINFYEPFAPNSQLRPFSFEPPAKASNAQLDLEHYKNLSLDYQKASSKLTAINTEIETKFKTLDEQSGNLLKQGLASGTIVEKNGAYAFSDPRQLEEFQNIQNQLRSLAEQGTESSSVLSQVRNKALMAEVQFEVATDKIATAERIKALQTPEGDLIRGTFRMLVEGVNQQAEGALYEANSLLVDVLSFVAPEALGGLTPDQAKKEINKIIMPSFQEGQQNVATGLSGVTEDYTRSIAEGSFIGGAYAGAIRSIPAMATPKGVGFFLQGYGGTMNEFNNTPGLENVDESYKQVFATTIGLVSHQLETYGFRNLLEGKAITKTIAMSVLKKLPESATKEVIERVVRDETKSIAGAFLNRTATGMAAEFETGAAQQAVDIGMKEFFNEFEGSEGKFRNPEGFQDVAKSILEAGAMEAVGALIIGSRANYKNAIRDNQLGQILQDQDFYKFEVSLRDPELFAEQMALIQSRIDSKLIPEKEGKEQLESMLKAQAVASKMPKATADRYNNLEARRAVFDLMSQKYDLSQELESVDDAAKPLLENKIAEIDQKIVQELDKMDAQVEQFGQALPAGRVAETAPVLTSEEASTIGFNELLSKVYRNPTPAQRAAVRYMYKQVRGMAQIAGPGTKIVIAPSETTELTTKGSIVFDRAGNVRGMGSAMVYNPQTNTIFINPKAYNKNVYAHETSHPFIEFLKDSNPEGFDSVFSSISGVVKENAAEDLIARGLVDAENEAEVQRVQGIQTYADWAQFISEKVPGQDGQIEAIVELMADIFEDKVASQNAASVRTAMVSLFDMLGMNRAAGYFRNQSISIDDAIERIQDQDFFSEENIAAISAALKREQYVKETTEQPVVQSVEQEGQAPVEAAPQGQGPQAPAASGVVQTQPVTNVPSTPAPAPATPAAPAASATPTATAPVEPAPSPEPDAKETAKKSTSDSKTTEEGVESKTGTLVNKVGDTYRLTIGDNHYVIFYVPEEEEAAPKGRKGKRARGKNWQAWTSDNKEGTAFVGETPEQRTELSYDAWSPVEFLLSSSRFQGTKRMVEEYDAAMKLAGTPNLAKTEPGAQPAATPAPTETKKEAAAAATTKVETEEKSKESKKRPAKSKKATVADSATTQTAPATTQTAAAPAPVEPAMPAPAPVPVEPLIPAPVPVQAAPAEPVQLPERQKVTKIGNRSVNALSKSLPASQDPTNTEVTRGLINLVADYFGIPPFNQPMLDGTAGYMEYLKTAFKFGPAERLADELATGKVTIKVKGKDTEVPLLSRPKEAFAKIVAFIEEYEYQQAVEAATPKAEPTGFIPTPKERVAPEDEVVVTNEEVAARLDDMSKNIKTYADTIRKFLGKVKATEAVKILRAAARAVLSPEGKLSGRQKSLIDSIRLTLKLEQENARNAEKKEKVKEAAQQAAKKETNEPDDEGLLRDTVELVTVLKRVKLGDEVAEVYVYQRAYERGRKLYGSYFLINNNEESKYIIPNDKNPETLTARDIPAIVRKAQEEANRIKKVAQKSAATQVTQSALIKPSIAEMLGTTVSQKAETSARTEILLIKKNGVPFRVYEPGLLRRGTYKEDGSIVYYPFKTQAEFFADYSRNFPQYTTEQKESRIENTKKRRFLAGKAVTQEEGGEKVPLLDTRGNKIIEPTVAKEEAAKTTKSTMGAQEIVELLAEAFGTENVKSTTTATTKEGAEPATETAAKEKKAPAVITVERTFVKPKGTSPIIKIVSVSNRNKKFGSKTATKLAYSIDANNLTISEQPVKGRVLIETKYTQEEFDAKVAEIQALVDSGKLDIAIDQKKVYVAKAHKLESMDDIMDEETDVVLRQAKAQAEKEKAARALENANRLRNQTERVNPENVPQEIIDGIGRRSTMAEISKLDEGTISGLKTLLKANVDELVSTPKGQASATFMIKWIEERLNNQPKGKSVGERLKSGLDMLIDSQTVPLSFAKAVVTAKGMDVKSTTIGDIHSLLYSCYQNNTPLAPKQLGLMNELDKKKKEEVRARFASRYSAYLPGRINDELKNLSAHVAIESQPYVPIKARINISTPSGRAFMSAITEQSMEDIQVALQSMDIQDVGDVVMLRNSDGQTVGSEFRFFSGMSSFVRGVIEDAIQEKINEKSLEEYDVALSTFEEEAESSAVVSVSYDEIDANIKNLAKLAEGDMSDAIKIVSGIVKDTLEAVEMALESAASDVQFDGSAESLMELVQQAQEDADLDYYLIDNANVGPEAIAIRVLRKMNPAKIADALTVTRTDMQFKTSTESLTFGRHNVIKKLITGGLDQFAPMKYRQKTQAEIEEFDSLFSESTSLREMSTSVGIDELTPFVTLNIPGNTKITGERITGDIISGALGKKRVQNMSELQVPQIGDRFGSVKDIAEIFSFMRSNRASFSAVVAVKGQSIVDYTVLTTFSNNNPSMSFPAQQYQNLVNDGTADAFMIVTSHPNGSSYPAEQDVLFNNSASALTGFRGSIVLGRNNFSYLPLNETGDNAFAVAGYNVSNESANWPDLSSLSMTSGKFATNGSVTLPSLIVNALNSNTYGGIMNSSKRVGESPMSSVGLVYLRKDSNMQFRLLGVEFVPVQYNASGKIKSASSVVDMVRKANVARREYGATNVIAVMPQDDVNGTSLLSDVIVSSQGLIDNVILSNTNSGAFDEYSVIPADYIDARLFNEDNTKVVAIKKFLSEDFGMGDFQITPRQEELMIMNKYGVAMDDESIQITSGDRVYTPSEFATEAATQAIKSLPGIKVSDMISFADFSISDIKSVELVGKNSDVIPAIVQDVARMISNAMPDINVHTAVKAVQNTKIVQSATVSQAQPIRMSAYKPSAHPFAQKMEAEAMASTKRIKQVTRSKKTAMMESIADKKFSVVNFIVKNTNANSSMAGKLLEAYIRTESGKSIAGSRLAERLAKQVFGKDPRLVTNELMTEVRDVLRARTIAETERRRDARYAKLFGNKQAALGGSTLADLKSELSQTREEVKQSNLKIKSYGKKIDAAILKGDAAAVNSLSIDLAYEQSLNQSLIESAQKLSYRVKTVEGTTRDLRGVRDPLLNPLGQTLEEAQDFLNNRASESPESFQYANEVVDRMFEVSKGMIKEKLDAGLISQAQHDALADYGYSPRIVLERLIDRELLRATGALSSSGAAGLKRLTTGTELPMVQDPLILFNAMVKTHTETLRRNEMKKRLYAFAKSANANTDVYIEEPNRDKDGNYATNKFGVYIYPKTTEAGSTVIEFFDGGQKYRMRASNFFFSRWQGLQNWGGDGYMLDVVGLLSGAKAVKYMATIYNPAFAVVNIIKDVIFVNAFTDVFGKTLTTSTIRYMNNLPNALIASIKKDKSLLYRQAEAGGFLMNFISQSDTELLNIKKQLERRRGYNAANVAQYVGDWINTGATYIQEVSEIMTRLAIFNQTLNDLTKLNPTLTQEELQTLAAAKSRQHLDYATSGQSSKVLENLLPYTNAAIRAVETSIYYASPKAGSSLFGNRLEESNAIINASAIAKIAEFCLGYATIMLFNNSIGEPEEEFDSKGARNHHDLDYFSPDIKERNIIILTSRRINKVTGKIADAGDENTVPEALSLGIPYELTPFVRLTQEVFAHTAPMMSDRHPDNLKSALSLGLEYYVPVAGKGVASSIEEKDPLSFISGLVGSVPIAAAVIAYEYNKDTYTGQEVFRNRYTDMASEDMYDDQTRATFVSVGQTLGMKPKNLQVAVEKLMTRPDNNYFARIAFAASDNATYESLIDSGVVPGTVKAPESMATIPVTALGKRLFRQGNISWLNAYNYDKLELSQEENEAISRARLDVRAIAKRWKPEEAQANAKEFVSYVSNNFDTEKDAQVAESLAQLYVKEIQYKTYLSPDAQNVARTQDTRQKAELLVSILNNEGENKLTEVLSQIYQYEQNGGSTIINEEVALKFKEYWDQVRGR